MKNKRYPLKKKEEYKPEEDTFLVVQVFIVAVAITGFLYWEVWKYVNH